MNTDSARDLHVIERAARHAERRIRLGRALAAGAKALCVGLVLSAIVLALPKTAVLHEGVARRLLVTETAIDAVDVTADDLDAMRDFLREMEQKQQTDEAKAATQEFNQLIEDLAAKRLDRTEAFRKMEALEDKLLEGREADAK